MNLKPKLLLSALLATLALPQAARAEQGQRLEIETLSDVQAPDAQAILHALLPDEGQGTREVRLIKTPNSSKLQLDVGGATLPSDSAAKLKAMFPQLRDATITVSTVELGAGLPALDKDEKDPAKIKAAIEKQLAAQGKPGKVDVQVTEDSSGKKQVRVTVEAKKEQ